MVPSQPSWPVVRSQRILLVGSAVEHFRHCLDLARTVRPGWFFEVARTARAALRLLAEHEIDVVVGAGCDDDSEGLLASVQRHCPFVRRVAVVDNRPGSSGLRTTDPDATIEPGAPLAEQMALLEALTLVSETGGPTPSRPRIGGHSSL